jgi:hypothetical protein
MKILGVKAVSMIRVVVHLPHMKMARQNWKQGRFLVSKIVVNLFDPPSLEGGFFNFSKNYF